MLVRGSLTSEESIARIALCPVAVIIHMLFAIILIVEFIVAGCTFIHDGGRRGCQVRTRQMKREVGRG